MSRRHKIVTNRPGYFLPLVLTLSTIAIIMATAIISVAYESLFIVKKQSTSNSALNIAEAGINYYLWHLSHNDKDYCDGTACTGPGPYGPFTHTYKDSSGNVVGSYSLTITPPQVNSPGVTTVKSVGQTTTGDRRTIQASLGVPSFSRYSFLTNSATWFASTEQTQGLVHSNSGIRFDGTAGGVISSSVATYSPDACAGGNNTTQNGIWGSGGPTSYWNFPVPTVDFNQVTSDLNNLRNAAVNDGIYLPVNVSGNKKTYSGYAIQLNANGTIRVGRVTGKSDEGGISGSCDNHSSYTSLVQNINWEGGTRSLPTNGVIFVEDNVWVWGAVTSRLTIASGRFPDTSSTNTSIYLEDNITYSAKDGSVALGLVAQKDITINADSEENLNLDGYFLAQKGRVFRPYYPGNTRTNLTIYGGVASNGRWTWNWYDGQGNLVSGYQNDLLAYDPYLPASPPPLFPKTGSFAILAWQEEPVL